MPKMFKGFTKIFLPSKRGTSAVEIKHICSVVLDNDERFFSLPYMLSTSAVRRYALELKTRYILGVMIK